MDAQLAIDSEAMVRTFLHDRDEPCDKCDYNLRNLTGTMCPECGWQVRLCIERPRRQIPRLAVWLSTLLLILFAIGNAWLIVNMLLYAPPLGGGGLPPGWAKSFILKGSLQLAAVVTVLVIVAVQWRHGPADRAPRTLVVATLLVLLLGNLWPWIASLMELLGL